MKVGDFCSFLMFYQITKGLGISILSALVLLSTLSIKGADVTFSRYYSDGMVIQRNKPARVKGFAPKGIRLTVSFAGQTKEVTADEKGCWTVTLDPLKANAKGQELKVSSQEGKQQASIGNVMIGDVFLFARQTSIDVSLAKTDDGKAIASKSGDAGFRVLRIKTLPSADPLNDLDKEAVSGWTPVNEQEALKMSGAAFHMGVALAKVSKVPVGIVDLNMGYYFPISWLSREDLLDTGKVMPKGTGKELYQATNAPEAQVAALTSALHKFKDEKLQAERKKKYDDKVALAKTQGKPLPSKPVSPLNPLLDPRFPAAGYNSVLHPLRGVAFKAVVLQLGNDYPYVMYQKIDRDGNALSRAHLGLAYKQSYDIRKWCIYLEPWTIPRMVPQWRLYFEDKDLPFGLIMPPGSDLNTLGEHHNAVRVLQRKVAEAHSRVGLILPGNKHVPFSAQPADEKLLAERAMSWVCGVSGEKNNAVSSGPMFESLAGDYSRATVFFKKGTADGLKAEPGALDHFEVAGADVVYYPAKAVIDGSTVRLECDKVNQIVHARYNWRNTPDQGLQNAAGLPAVPFRTDEYKYPTTLVNSETDLPEEYLKPARDWKNDGVAIINGSLAPGNWHDGEGWLGACGVLVAPFGPNMSVLNVLKGSPADGKILIGDLIYDVNRKLIGDHPLHIVAEAIAHAESEAGNGEITFGLRRGTKNLEVALKLEILGTYSSTSPYDCPKTDRIVANMEKFLAKRGGVMQSHTTFQNCDALFLLASGKPEYQGLVRRLIYKRIANTDVSKRLDPMVGPHLKSWGLAYDALLAGEYFLATGDRNVLPFLKWNCDYLAMTQNKVESGATPWPTALAGQAGGWRHNFYGQQAYGMLPNVGLPALLGFRFAIESGLDIDRAAYKRGIDYFIHNGAKVGSVYYGHSPTAVTVPKPIDDDALKNGMLSSFNGAKALAALLFKYEGDLRTAHLLSFVCANSYNNTHHAHGGNFWGNAWTGLGAYVHSKDSFMQFMQGHAWYRDLHRIYNHGHYQGMRGGVGGGQYLALVLPKHRLRILGAPESVFSVNPKEFFRPALDAYRRRDYAKCAKLVDELMSLRTLSTADKAKAEQLRGISLELLKSIELDLSKVEGLIKEGKLYEASLDLPQLEGVVSPGNERLTVISNKLKDTASKDAISKDMARYKEKMKKLQFDMSIPKPAVEDESRWTCLTPHSDLVGASFRSTPGKVSEEDATRWSMKVVESMKVAPEGWANRDFDASSWTETSLPISWALNHTALFRTTFEVKNRKDIEALRIRLWTYRQQNVQVFINGQLVAKVNKSSNNNVTTSQLSEQAVQALKTGKNTIAVTTRHNWRWGSYMGGDGTDRRNSVRNNGFTLLLYALKK